MNYPLLTDIRSYWKLQTFILGKQDYDEAVTFIARKFMAMDREPNRRIYMHQTCATDTNQVQLVIDSVVDTVIAKNLRGTGMN